MNILIDMPVHEPLLNALKNLPGLEIAVVDHPEERVRRLPTAQIEQCDALFCTFPPENHAEMKNLNYIQISSAGFNQLVGLGLEQRNIKACNSLGVFDVPIAEWNIAMMVNVSRNMREMMHNQDKQVWDRSAHFQREIRGAVVGIWGYGGIGRETARLAKALGMKIHVMSREGVKPRENSYCVKNTGDPEGVLPDKVYLPAEKHAFLKNLDFLILAMPHSAATEGIIGEDELQLLPKHAFLLNPARGPLVQEAALIRALQENWIAGVALDTHYHYPMPTDHPLWKLPNVIMTPHISGSSLSPKFLERVYDLFFQNVVRLQQGKELLNELSPSQLVGS